MLKRMKACIQLRGKNVENRKIREAALAAFESAEVEDNFNPHELDFDAVELPGGEVGLQIVPSCRFRK